jgi:hypothetical protein
VERDRESAPEPPEPASEAPVPPPRSPQGRDVDLAAETGRLAGRTATGLSRLLLRNRTVRKTLRNARNAARDDER